MKVPTGAVRPKGIEPGTARRVQEQLDHIPHVVTGFAGPLPAPFQYPRSVSDLTPSGIQSLH